MQCALVLVQFAAVWSGAGITAAGATQRDSRALFRLGQFRRPDHSLLCPAHRNKFLLENKMQISDICFDVKRRLNYLLRFYLNRTSVKCFVSLPELELIMRFHREEGGNRGCPPNTFSWAGGVGRMEIDCGVEKAARHCPDSRRQSAGWKPLAPVSLHPIGIITSFGTKKTLARQC